MHLACLLGNAPLLERLFQLEESQSEILDRNGDTCIHLATRQDCDTLRVVLDHRERRKKASSAVDVKNYFGKLNKTPVFFRFFLIGN